jgi:hypothetical protein
MRQISLPTLLKRWNAYKIDSFAYLMGDPGQATLERKNDTNGGPKRELSDSHRRIAF